MTADPASDVSDRTSLLHAKMGSGKRGRGGSSVVRTNEGISHLRTTRLKHLEVSSNLSFRVIALTQPQEPAPPIPPTLPEGYFPYFLPPPGYFQGADGQNGAPPVQVPFYSYHQLAPFPYSAGIPMPFMQQIAGQPGPSGQPVEPLQPQNTKGKRRRGSTDELSTPKKSKTDDQQINGTPDGEGNDPSPPTAEPAPRPSEPPSSER